MGKTNGNSEHRQQSTAGEAVPGAPGKKRARNAEQKEVPLRKLRRAVGDKVLEQTDQIAESLINNTIKGNSNTARLVVSLVDKKPVTPADLKQLKKVARKPKKLQTAAMDLASDPPWRDPEGKIAPGAEPESRKESGDANEDR